MKKAISIIVLLFLSLNCFSQLKVVDTKTSPSASAGFNNQSNTIKVKLPFTAFVGNNSLVDNYLCYNGKYYYLLANKTSNPSDKSVSFVLGTTKESSIRTLRDLNDLLMNNKINTSVKVNMGGVDYVIEKTDVDILSFSSLDRAGVWLLDKNQIQTSINHLLNKGEKGGGGIGFGSGAGSGVGTGSGIGPGQGSGSGGGFGLGTGVGTGIGAGSGGSIGYGTGSRGLVHPINTSVSEEGQVCVEVHVLADGTVSEARIINSGNHKTTVMNKTIQQQCVQEAKRAKYKPGKEELRIIVFH